MDKQYEVYLKGEWDKFQSEPHRRRESLEAVGSRPVQRVLDVGCGAGQELLPFVVNGALGVGVDLAPDVGVLGRQLFCSEGYANSVWFVRSLAEQLPFPSSAFDVLISRVALPYSNNPAAIAEIARVLRPDGILLLKIHHGWYYLHKLWRGVVSGNFLSSVHAGRVLASGVIYHLTGSQVRNRLLTGETFQSRWLLNRELARYGLVIVREIPDSNSRTPSFVIRKHGRTDVSGR